MIRLGLCCVFHAAPIKFRRTTVKHLRSLPRRKQLQRIAEICGHNAAALLDALRFCKDHGIGAFRINSQILPVKTHPLVGYAIEELPEHEQIVDAFRVCGRFSRKHGIRTSFHPDQFIVLNSPRVDVVQRSTAELVYHAQVAQWVNADVINLHGGGAYGDKQKALKRLADTIGQLPAAVRRRLTLENDDRIFTPLDLLPVCHECEIALVYDAHHHRCLGDGVDIQTATQLALATWTREPLFHLSSPLHAWGTGDCRPHHDYIDIEDFPCPWADLDITVDIEAKAKEKAILRLIEALPGYLRHCP